MKAKNGQVDGELMAIKLFRNNYARDLVSPFTFVVFSLDKFP